MTASAQQLVFDLPIGSAFGAEDFFPSASNTAAVSLIDQWPDWSSWAAVVTGPRQSGKSHLANVWRQRSNASIVAASALSDSTIDALTEARALVVEDLDRGLSAHKTLFHLLNTARERRYSILLTSRAAPGQLDIALPDLRSRLRALPVVHIEPPDENLLRLVLVKQFADRQIAIAPETINYVALRMPRSMDGAADLVCELDRLALTRHRRITRNLALEALRNVEARQTSTTTNRDL